MAGGSLTHNTAACREVRYEPMLRRGIIICLALLLAVLALRRALAQEQPSQQRLRVTADEIAFDAKKGTLVAAGGVRMTGADLLLTCGRLQASVDQKAGTLSAVEATENVQFEMRYHQQEQEWQVTAAAARARFLPQERVLVAEGGAVVEVKAAEPSDQHYRLSGDSVEFDLDQRRLVARKEQSQPEMEITLPSRPAAAQ